MKNIRYGNDIHFVWAITRGGQPEDLTSLINAELILRSFNKKQTIPFTIVDTNKISIELKRTIIAEPGIYNLEFSYTISDTGFSDGIRACTVDIDPFVIVTKSEHASGPNEFAVTSDMAFGFQGKSAYDVWLETHEGTLEDYENWLQKPATDAVSLIEDKIETLDTAIQQEEQRELAEGVRLSNEQSRVEVEGQRATAESNRNDNELLRKNEESSRVNAETSRVNAEQSRITAETNRNNAESARNNAESDRNNTESDRNSAENIRIYNEQERIDAEESRVTAEENRQSNFNSFMQVSGSAVGALIGTVQGDIDDAVSQAQIATQNANTATINADNARLAIQDDLGLKLDKSSVKQVLGASTTDVMSQKAVTDELAKKHQVVVDYTHTGNKEVNIESIDFATGTITATGHGLAANNDVFVTNNQDNILTFPYVAVPNGLEFGKRYYPVNITTNTFQLSTTPGGSPIVISDKATKDYTKWHLEGYGAANIANLSLRKFIIEFSGRSNGGSANTDYFYLRGGKEYGQAGDVWHVDTERQKIATGTLGRTLLGTMLNGDIWMYSRLEIDVTGKRATILINGYRIYSVNDTTRGITKHINDAVVHSTVGDDTITSFTQILICNGINIKVTKIL